MVSVVRAKANIKISAWLEKCPLFPFIRHPDTDYKHITMSGPVNLLMRMNFETDENLTACSLHFQHSCDLQV